MKQKNRQLARLNSKVTVLGCTLTMSCRRSHPNAPEGASGASFKCWWLSVESRAGSRIEMDSELMENGYGYWWYSCPSILSHKDSATGAKSHGSEASYKHIWSQSGELRPSKVSHDIAWHRSKQLLPVEIPGTWLHQEIVPWKPPQDPTGASVNSKRQRLMDGISAQVARNNYDRDSNR